MLLGLVSIDPTQSGYYKERPKIETWVAQAALSRPGRRKEGKARQVDIDLIVHEPRKLRWSGRGSR